MVNENHCTAIYDSNTVNFGHSPTLPIDIMLGQLPLSDGEKNPAEYVKEVTLSLKSTYDKVRDKSTKLARGGMMTKNQVTDLT